MAIKSNQWYSQTRLYRHRHPLNTDTSLLRTVCSLSLGKDNPYNFSKFNPFNTDTPLIRTVSVPPSVTFLTGFYCSSFILLSSLTIERLNFFLSEIQKTQTNDKPTPGQDTGFRSKRRPAQIRKRFGEVSYHNVKVQVLRNAFDASTALNHPCGITPLALLLIISVLAFKLR